MTPEELERLLAGRKPGLMDATGRYAVLVPLVRRADGLYLLYEVRAKGMRRQPGEVCFPGGRMERGETPERCALRETREELGLPDSAIHLLGQLDFIAHRASFILYPVLAVVDSGAVEGITLNQAEVDSVFLVPVEHLRGVPPREYSYALEPTLPEDFPYEDIGIPRDYRWQRGRENVPVYQWHSHAIWGLTGRITRHLMGLMGERGQGADHDGG